MRLDNLYDLLSTGIGHVLNLRFNPSFSHVLWDPPPTAGILGNLTYHLTVTNMDTGVVIINTTTTSTTYTIGSSVPFCTVYKANVTALLGEHKSDEVSHMRKTEGSK